MEGFADIEGPVWIGELWVILLISVGALALASTLLLLYLRHRRRRPPKVDPVMLRSPQEIAHERLEHLRAGSASMTAEPFTVEVSDIVRDYLESALRIPAREQTSEEFLQSLQVRAGLPDILHRRMPGFLEQCDRVKFARQDLAGNQREELLDTAATVIDETEGQLHNTSAVPETSPEPA